MPLEAETLVERRGLGDASGEDDGEGSLGDRSRIRAPTSGA